MIRVLTRNNDRTVDEMSEMWQWLIKTFKRPGFKNNWTYGKKEEWAGSTICSGPFEIEWIDFANHDDATLFLLRWA